ncbi:hypothetical protein ACLOJK_029105 [Asimina triloba]
MKVVAAANLSIFFAILPLVVVVAVCNAQDFDFFYFVQQWPASLCDTKRSCCYPATGKPAADFGIHGLWPNYNDRSYPSNCDPDSEFDGSQMEDLLPEMQARWPTLACPTNNGSRFWAHEWEKHGTCSESVLSQHDYFEAALNLKKQVNLLQILRDAGIEADGGFYSPSSITEAIREATGFMPGLQCNFDEGRNPQLYQIFQCVDASGKEFIECPVLPTFRCANRIEFPVF